MRAWLPNILARWPLRQTIDRWALFGIVGMVLVALWGLILWFAAVQKQRLLDESQRELVHLSSAVAHHTESLFRSVETALHVIDHWLQTHPETDPLRDASFQEFVDRLRRTDKPRERGAVAVHSRDTDSPNHHQHRRGLVSGQRGRGADGADQASGRTSVLCER